MGETEWQMDGQSYEMSCSPIKQASAQPLSSVRGLPGGWRQDGIRRRCSLLQRYDQQGNQIDKISILVYVLIIPGKNVKNDGNQKIILADKANFSFDFGFADDDDFASFLTN